MVIDLMLFKDFEVFIWLGPITMVTVYNVTMVMLYTYHFRCVDPVFFIHKSTSFLQIIIPTSAQYLARCHELSFLIMSMSVFSFNTI